MSAATSPSPAVTVAVVSWNTRDLLARCLRSLRADAVAGRAEVRVVDNGSTDGSRDLVRTGFPWADLIESDSNLGFGGAVNLAARAARGAWIAPANADVELAPGALEVLVLAGARDPAAGAVAPRLLLPDGSVQPSVQGFPSLGRSLLFHARAHRIAPRLGERLLIGGCWDPDRPRVVDWATGAFLLVRREAFEQVGGFDAEQWMYAEDLDLGWRLARRGWTTLYEPAATVHHHHGAAAATAFGDRDEVTARWMRATYAWMARRRGMAFTWAHAGLDLAEAGARVAILTPLALASSRRWGARRRRALASVRLFRLGLSSPRRLARDAQRPLADGRRPG